MPPLPGGRPRGRAEVLVPAVAAVFEAAFSALVLLATGACLAGTGVTFCLLLGGAELPVEPESPVPEEAACFCLRRRRAEPVLPPEPGVGALPELPDLDPGESVVFFMAGVLSVDGVGEMGIALS